MKFSHWLIALAAVLTGVALGLFYGWVVQPVQYVDVTPGILRADYRADYILMVAEAHQQEQNAEMSARRLAALGSEAPAEMVAWAVEYAAQNGFSAAEMALLRGLLNAMQTYQPQGGGAP